MNLWLIGAVAPKHVSWLTPLWLFGVGAIAAMLLLAVLWGICWAFSRVSSIGNLTENRSLFFKRSVQISSILFGAVAIWGVVDAIGIFRSAGVEAGFPHLIRMLVLALPIAAAIWMVVSSALALASRRLLSEIDEAATEGLMLPVMSILLVLAVVGFAGSFVLRPPIQSMAILNSLMRVTSVGPQDFEFTVEASDDPEVIDGRKEPPSQAIEIAFRGAELREITIASTQDIAIVRASDTSMDSPESLHVLGGIPFQWTRRGLATELFGPNPVEKLFVRNRGSEDAKISITTRTEIVYPQTMIVPWIAISVSFLILAYLVLRVLAPRVSAIALATFKSETAQPIFLIAISLTAVFLCLSVFFPYHTFGEDIKMLKDAGLNVIKVACIIVAIWGASTTVADEIEGKTALTVLSKPISRRSFIIGKFTGISWTVALMYIILGLLLLVVVSYKVIYDAREAAKEFPSWEIVHAEVIGTVAPLILSFFEAMVLAGISVAISTRLPMLPNFVICFSLYAIGHLTRTIIEGTQAQFAIVKFFGQLVGVIVPGLEAYDVHSAIDAGLGVPTQYVLVVGGYSAIFAVISLLLALILFEDRDVS